MIYIYTTQKKEIVFNSEEEITPRNISELLINPFPGTALKIAAFINKFADLNETILVDEDIRPTDYRQMEFIIDLIREIRINPYFGDVKSKIRKSRIIVRVPRGLSRFLQIFHETFLLTSPNVIVWDEEETDSSPSFDKHPMTYEELDDVKQYIPQTLGNDDIDDRHNQANLWNVFQFFRFSKGLVQHSTYFQDCQLSTGAAPI
jgi:hypothetical protein